RRDAGAVEEIGRQADDPLDEPTPDQTAADIRLGVSAEEHAMRKDAGPPAAALQRADDMEQIGIVPLLRRGRAEVHETFVRIMERIDAGAPALVAEGGIGNDVVEGLQPAVVRE